MLIIVAIVDNLGKRILRLTFVNKSQVALSGQQTLSNYLKLGFRKS